MAEAVKADCETGHIRGIFLMSVGGVCVDCGGRWLGTKAPIAALRKSGSFLDWCVAVVKVLEQI